MADVLLGRADGIEGFERHVVVKRIKSDHAKDKRFIQMFLDEARLAATLHHQNVVQVHDIGEENGEYFFAMEYLHGEDLRKLLGATSKARTHLALGNVVSIIAAAAAGLHYAHERRDNNKKKLDIVHRDVSPSNIIVGYDGSVKVLDFGIAKAAMRTSDTRTGTLKGKTSYMSPEQCKGVQSIDRRSDVYSLGVVLYELATTARLFKADSDYLVMDAIVNGKVPLPRVKRPDLPNDLSSIIMRALAVDPDRRYQTADELRIALEQCAENSNLTVSTSSLATQMKKLFGDKPEPWLELNALEQQDARSSWSELGAQDGDDAETSLSDPPTTDQRKHPSASPRALSASASHKAITTRTPSSPPSPADSVSSGVPKRKSTSVPPLVELSKPPRASSVNDTRTSTRMAWEYQGQAPEVIAVAAPMRKRTKALLLGGPIVIALGGLAVWNQMAKPVVKPAAPTEATQPTVTAIDTPDAPAPRKLADDSIVTPPIVTPPTVTSTQPTRTPRTNAVRTPTSAVIAPAPVPDVVAPAPFVPAPNPATTTPPTPAVVAPAPVAPVVEPPPATDKPAVTQLSAATVSLVAGDHAAQLAKCENQATLHGDVAITFEINAAGKVTTSQVSSTVHNVKVAACILTAVRSWQFPKPPSGAAKGVYTITYQ